jgi:hypothetical protein
MTKHPAVKRPEACRRRPRCSQKPRPLHVWLRAVAWPIGEENEIKIWMMVCVSLPFVVLGSTAVVLMMALLERWETPDLFVLHALRGASVAVADASWECVLRAQRIMIPR